MSYALGIGLRLALLFAGQSLASSSSHTVPPLQTKKYADVIVPRGADNIGMADIIAFHTFRFEHGEGQKA